jgi:chemotaxis protein methyltransferase CheR
VAFTFFFRDQQVLERLVEQCLPLLAGRSRPRVWDAGAATGQEPFTLAMLFAERMGHFAFDNLRIDATDIDDAGQFARQVESAAYPEKDVGRLPAEILARYFEPDTGGDHRRVAAGIRRRVAYQQHDLLSFREIGQGYAAVVCKNVLLHLQPAERIEVFRMFHRALGPGGLLAIERTQEMPGQVDALFTPVLPGESVFRRRDDTAWQS